LALNRDQDYYTIHIGIKDLDTGTGTPSRQTWLALRKNLTFAARSVFELGMLLTAKARGVCVRKGGCVWTKGPGLGGGSRAKGRRGDPRGPARDPTHVNTGTRASAKMGL
jgi:hypothetical protein